MNYYPFHVGDYLSHTSHLEPIEDLAYRRMLDLYYRTEKSLPVNPEETARLIRLRDHEDVVVRVLTEFFEKAKDGWHSKRADAELTSMLAKQEQQASRDEHEADRMKRYRERRAGMFAALRERGVVPAWDVSIKELQRLHDENCTQPATDLQREQVANSNAPATAIPIPTPTPTPTPVLKKRAQPAVSPPPKSPEGVGQQVWDDWLALRKAKKAPVTATVVANAEREAAKAGLSMDEFLAVWCARGSQGLQADWIKPAEKPQRGSSPEPAWRTEQRERTAAFAGPYAQRPTLRSHNIIEAEDAVTATAPPRLD